MAVTQQKASQPPNGAMGISATSIAIVQATAALVAARAEEITRDFHTRLLWDDHSEMHAFFN